MRLGVLEWRIPRLALIVPLLAVIALSASLGLLTPHKAEALDSEEQSFLGVINDYRAQNGLGPLAINETLNGVARWMANDMGANNYFSHTDSLGRDPFARMDQLGYNFNTWRGENLVAGTEGADYAFQMWKGSPGHNENMLGSHYTAIGIARVYYASSTYGWYWATEFGGEGGAAPPPPPAPTVPPAQPATAYAPPPPPAPTNPPAAAPVNVVQPTPANTAESSAAIVTSEPTATPAPLIPHERVAWWHTFDALSIDWDFALFARQLVDLAPSLEHALSRLLDGS